MITPIALRLVRLIDRLRPAGIDQVEAIELIELVRGMEINQALRAEIERLSGVVK